MSTVNVDKVQAWIKQGRIDPKRPITIKELVKTRCLHGVKDGVKLLARNADQVQTPFHITVSRASATAIAAIEAAGGSVQTRYYTRNSIKRVLKGETHPTNSLQSRPHLTLRSSITATTLRSPNTDAVTTAVKPLTIPTLKPGKYQYRLPDPTARKDLEYYRDPAHRGYLSWQVKEGESPSLFFKTPKAIALGEVPKKSRSKAGAAKTDVSIW